MYLWDKLAGSCVVESQLQRKAYGSFVRALTETIMHQQCEQGKNIAAWSEILIRNTWYRPCLGMAIWKVYLPQNSSIYILSRKTGMLVGGHFSVLTQNGQNQQWAWTNRSFEMNISLSFQWNCKTASLQIALQSYKEKKLFCHIWGDSSLHSRKLVLDQW